MAEYPVSIYGRKQSEWDQLASWFINNELHSENAVWLIQLPRLYNIYRKMGTATSFQNILDNVFLPLFEVTVDPNSHPQLHVFLKQVVGFDLVDDESKPERRPTKHMPTPAEWTNEFNPAFGNQKECMQSNSGLTVERLEILITWLLHSFYATISHTEIISESLPSCNIHGHH